MGRVGTRVGSPLLGLLRDNPGKPVERVSCNLKEEIVMEIVSKTEGSKVTMEITGWLDTQTAPQLEKELSALDPGTTSPGI